MAEIGYQLQWLPGWGSFSSDEHESNPALRWPRSVEVFDKMRHGLRQQGRGEIAGHGLQHAARQRLTG